MLCWWSMDLCDFCHTLLLYFFKRALKTICNTLASTLTIYIYISLSMNIFPESSFLFRNISSEVHGVHVFISVGSSSCTHVRMSECSECWIYVSLSLFRDSNEFNLRLGISVYSNDLLNMHEHHIMHTWWGINKSTAPSLPYECNTCLNGWLALNSIRNIDVW